MKLRNLLHIMLFTSVLITLSGCTRASTGSNTTETPSFSPDSSSAASLASEALSSEPDNQPSAPASSNVDNENVSSKTEMESIKWVPDIPYDDYIPSQPEVAEEVPPEELLEWQPDPEGYFDFELETDDYQEVLEAFTIRFMALQFSQPSNSRYAITDIKILYLEISEPTFWGKGKADFSGYIRYAVKPCYNEYPLAGGAIYGTEELEGYIVNGRTYDIGQVEGDYWTSSWY